MTSFKGDLDILTELLIESEGAEAEEQEANPAEQEEDFDSLFDDDTNGEEEYKESVEEEGQHMGTEHELSDLFGDVDDIEEEAKRNDGNKECKTLNKSREDLQGLFLHFSKKKPKTNPQVVQVWSMVSKCI